MFTFERSRFITTARIANKTHVSLNEATFNLTTSISTFQETLVNNLPATKSGKTLSAILSISHPNDLNSYTINSVTPPVRGGRAVVSYSCEDGVEFHRKRADDLEREKESLKHRLDQALRDLQILVEWQTANLVLHAFAQFAWDQVSIPDKAELELYDVNNFLHLFYGRNGNFPRAKRNAVYRILRKLPDTILGYADHIVRAKYSVSTERKHLAHPEISQERLEFFLQTLGSGAPDQDPLEIALFRHLKTVSISKENVERAAKGR